MKNLLYILFAVTLFISCSSDDDNTPSQEYTSFVVANDSDIDLPNCVVGYKSNDKWIKVASLGDLKQGATSSEIKLPQYINQDFYVFTDYISPRRIDIAFKVRENYKSVFSLIKGSYATTVDKNNNSEYPL